MYLITVTYENSREKFLVGEHSFHFKHETGVLSFTKENKQYYIKNYVCATVEYVNSDPE